MKTKTPTGIVQAILTEMGYDNDEELTPTEAQRTRLETLVGAMQVEGVKFTEGQIMSLAAGEEIEREEEFKNSPSFPEFNALLNLVFDG